MQATQNLSPPQLREIVAAIYGQGPAIVKQASSSLGRAPRQFIDANALIEELRFQPAQEYAFFSFAIYYPEAKGHTFEKRVNFNPESCDGPPFRFEPVGWGLIYLQCCFREYPRIECRIAVNSGDRAGNWSDTHPDLKSPDLWDWVVIQRKAGRLIRLLRKLGKLADPGAAPDRNGG